MKYLKLFKDSDFKDKSKFGTNLIKESQNSTKTGSEFISFVEQKSSSTSIYVDYLKNVEASKKKFTCQVGQFVLSYDDTTKREYKGEHLKYGNKKVLMVKNHHR